MSWEKLWIYMQNYFIVSVWLKMNLGKTSHIKSVANGGLMITILLALRWLCWKYYCDGTSQILILVSSSG